MGLYHIAALREKSRCLRFMVGATPKDKLAKHLREETNPIVKFTLLHIAAFGGCEENLKLILDNIDY